MTKFLLGSFALGHEHCAGPSLKKKKTSDRTIGQKQKLAQPPLPPSSLAQPPSSAPHQSEPPQHESSSRSPDQSIIASE